MVTAPDEHQKECLLATDQKTAQFCTDSPQKVLSDSKKSFAPPGDHLIVKQEEVSCINEESQQPQNLGAQKEQSKLTDRVDARSKNENDQRESQADKSADLEKEKSDRDEVKSRETLRMQKKDSYLSAHIEIKDDEPSQLG